MSEVVQEIIFDEGTGGTQGTTLKDKSVFGSPDGRASGNSGNRKSKSKPIPASDRPCFITHDEPEPPYIRPGLWYHGIKDGDPPILTDTWICTPIYAEAQTFGEDGGNHGLLLRFKASSGKWRVWAMPMHLLKGDGSDLRGELLDRGWRLDPNCRALFGRWLLAEYPKEKLTAVSSVGWTASSFVLPARIVGNDKLVFQNEGAADHFSTKGTVAEWREQVGRYLAGNPLLILAASAALAGPLLHPTGRQGGGIHLVGDSSTGKSTALQVAASVWGAPDFTRTWRATANGLEGAAGEVNDTCLILDEISQADPRDVGSIIYTVGNGTGKARANRVGLARRTARWRVMLLSSGERTLAAHMAEDRGRAPKAGQLVRLLDIPVKRQHGLFDELHSFPTGAALADHLKTATAKTYGVAGQRFLDRLVTERETLDLPSQLSALLTTTDFHHVDGLHQRAAGALALCAIAGELARQWGLFPISDGEGIAAAALAFRLWGSLQTTGRTEDRQVLQAIVDFIDRHGGSRFQSLLADDHPPIRDRAGWVTDNIFYFTGAGLREAVAGHDLSRALDALESAGWIAEHDPGKRSKKMRVEGRPVSLYAIRVGEVAHG
ncbi:DUF927 domain-containing protein [Acidithiobacillus sp. AMEEHan]|uniref:DUF927 domain-containing protein n=1 Tax=Acidithiobacillus sp. AMEEHan TaxID=2994951 RepID=UPI0027E4C588|nr:DUF927 domain-containing protein [Acidithiobacillus sp. AMEEHan]